MSDLFRNPHCWFSHAISQVNIANAIDGVKSHSDSFLLYVTKTVNANVVNVCKL